MSDPTIKITPNERRALAEFKKPKVNWDKVHGRTKSALQRKKLIYGLRLTTAGRAALNVPNIFDDLFEQKEAPMRKAPKTAKTKLPSDDVFRAIEFIETTLHDTVRDRWDPDAATGGVRLYCTAGPLTHGKENARWALQVRAQVKTKHNGLGKHFAVGTASMSREDLRWLREQIDVELRRKA